jgi:hypothetical protein
LLAAGCTVIWLPFERPLGACMPATFIACMAVRTRCNYLNAISSVVLGRLNAPCFGAALTAEVIAENGVNHGSFR